MNSTNKEQSKSTFSPKQRKQLREQILTYGQLVRKSPCMATLDTLSIGTKKEADFVFTKEQKDKLENSYIASSTSLEKRKRRKEEISVTENQICKRFTNQKSGKNFKENIEVGERLKLVENSSLDEGGDPSGGKVLGTRITKDQKLSPGEQFNEIIFKYKDKRKIKISESKVRDWFTRRKAMVYKMKITEGQDDSVPLYLGSDDQDEDKLEKAKQDHGQQRHRGKKQELEDVSDFNLEEQERCNENKVQEKKEHNILCEEERSGGEKDGVWVESKIDEEEPEIGANNDNHVLHTSEESGALGDPLEKQAVVVTVQDVVVAGEEKIVTEEELGITGKEPGLTGEELEASYDYWKFQLENETQSVISSLFLPLMSLNLTRKELLSCLKRLRRARYKLKDKVAILLVLTDYYVFASCLPGLGDSFRHRSWSGNGHKVIVKLFGYEWSWLISKYHLESKLAPSILTSVRASLSRCHSVLLSVKPEMAGLLVQGQATKNFLNTCKEPPRQVVAKSASIKPNSSSRRNFTKTKKAKILHKSASAATQRTSSKQYKLPVNSERRTLNHNLKTPAKPTKSELVPMEPTAPTISRRLRSKHDHNLRTPAEANPSESVINNKCVSASRPSSSEYRRNLKTHVQEKKSQLVHRAKHTSGKTHGNHMIASNLQHLAERFPSITFSFAPVEKKKSNVSSIISMQQANNVEKKNKEGSTNMVSKVGRGYWADPKEVLDEFKENDIEEISIDYEVERLLNYQAGQYLVKWVGYSEQESTWEPEEHLDCPELLLQFYLSRLKIWQMLKPHERHRLPLPRDPRMKARMAGGPPSKLSK